MFDRLYRPAKDTTVRYEKHHRNQQFGTVEQLKEMSQKAGISNHDWMSFAKQRNYSNRKILKPKPTQILQKSFENPVHSSLTPKKVENRMPIRYEVSPPRVPPQQPRIYTRSKSLQRLGREAMGLDQKFAMQQRQAAYKSPPPVHNQRKIPEAPKSFKTPPRLADSSAFMNRNPTTPVAMMQYSPIENKGRRNTNTNYNNVIETLGNFGTLDYTMLKVGETKPKTDWSVNNKKVWKGMGWKDTAGLIA